jgi:hypothetical protein
VLRASRHYRACVPAALAVTAASCSLATARAAIRQTRARIPTLAGSSEPPMRADPALADAVVCAGPVVAVSIASGGTAGDTAWLAFVRDRARWRVVKAAGGYKLRLLGRAGGVEVVQPVYRRRDPNCCPTGGFDRVLYRYDGRRLAVARQWHTRTFDLKNP